MTPMPNAEWRGRAAFAEVAEALSLRTDQVMAAMQADGLWTVLWSDHLEDGADVDTPVTATRLQRDDAGVLHIISTTDAGTLGSFLDAMRED